MRQLEAFRATIMKGTVSAAAKSLKITQPTVSRLLADLEHSLQLNLLQRRKGQVVPTAEGMAFYRKLDNVFDAFSQLRDAAKDISRDNEKSLYIISLPALSISIVPEIIKEFSIIHPEVSITLDTSPVREYFSRIMDDSLDIAFGNHMGDQPNIEQLSLATVEYVCALPPKHRLAKKEVITPDDLEGECLITLTQGENLLFQKHEDCFKEINHIKKFNTLYSGNAYAMILQGLGVAILEPFSAPLWKAVGVEIRPFKPKLEYTYSAYYQEKKKQNRIIKEMLNIAKNKFKEYET